MPNLNWKMYPHALVLSKHFAFCGPSLNKLGISLVPYQLYPCSSDTGAPKFGLTVSTPQHLCLSFTPAGPVSMSRGARMGTVQETTCVISSFVCRYVTPMFLIKKVQSVNTSCKERKRISSPELPGSFVLIS